MYYLLLPDLASRTAFIEKLKKAGIQTVFHYIPLHSAPAGLRYARAHGELPVTNDISDRLVRLPLWNGLAEHQTGIIQTVLASM
jgi:dTDP-4-amino-4,6-dideoxygalactose transaminase